jgi:hypothetical protein
MDRSVYLLMLHQVQQLWYIKGNILEFVWKDWNEMKNFWTSAVPAEIWTRNLQTSEVFPFVTTCFMEN